MNNVRMIFKCYAVLLEETNTFNNEAIGDVIEASDLRWREQRFVGDSSDPFRKEQMFLMCLNTLFPL